MSDPSVKVSGLAAQPANVLEDTVELAADDRRASPRYGFTATAEVVDMGSRTRMNTRISDLGMEGCYVDTNAPFPRRTKVRIRISNAKKTFETLGIVVYSLPNMGMGISFSQPETSQHAILKKWIDELSGAAPLDFEPIDTDASASRQLRPQRRAAPCPSGINHRPDAQKHAKRSRRQSPAPKSLQIIPN